MKFGSLFAGIRGFDLALSRAGMRSVYAAEREADCNSVARRHFPDEVQIDDVAAVRGSGFRADLVCAGWPCQGNSVAGRRDGMADERSGLWWEVMRILAEARPRWFLGENVPGLLSVNRGRDFGAILGSLAKLGYGFAYRILDAQWFGVPQRRRRVFIVGYLGDWKRPAEILFERESLPWNSPPRRKKKSEVAGTLGGGVKGRGWSDDLDRAGAFVAGTLQATDGGMSVDRVGELVASKTAYAVTTREGQRLGDCQCTLVAYNASNYSTGEYSEADKSSAITGSTDKTRNAPIVAYQCHGSNVGPVGTLRAGGFSQWRMQDVSFEQKSGRTTVDRR